MNTSSFRKTMVVVIVVLVGIFVVNSPAMTTLATTTSKSSVQQNTTAKFLGATMANRDLSRLIGKDPKVKVERITLPAAECTAINRVRPDAVSRCQALHYWAGASYLPLPRGMLTAISRLAANDYWYWSWSDQVCSIYGCRYWSISSSEDGVANGTNVWRWNHGCTPSGINVSCTWSGDSYNGGGWPNYAMQFGVNGQYCTIQAGSVGVICFLHGLRRWIDDWGQPAVYYSW